jgi:ABC-type transporter Mla subunit MlaD
MAARARKTTLRAATKARPTTAKARAARGRASGGAAPKAKAPAAGRSAALDEVAERLAHTQEALHDTLARLPRPEDFEPLVRPLSEFARVAPALAESLAELVRLTRPLAESAAGLKQLAESLRPLQARLQEAAAGPSDALRTGAGLPAAAGTRPGTPPLGASAELDRLLGQVAETLAGVRLDIRSALAQLPREPAYARVAGQLRELASASPSLLEWLREVPPLVQPLSAAVASLAAGAERLERSEQSLRQARAGLRGEP